MRRHLNNERSELAAKLREIGISESYASQLVNRKRTPSRTLAVKIQGALGIEPAWWDRPAEHVEARQTQTA